MGRDAKGGGKVGGRLLEPLVAVWVRADVRHSFTDATHSLLLRTDRTGNDPSIRSAKQILSLSLSLSRLQRSKRQSSSVCM